MAKYLITSVLLPLALLAAQLNRADGVDPRRTPPPGATAARDPLAVTPPITPAPSLSTPQLVPAPTNNPARPSARNRNEAANAGAVSAPVTTGAATSQLLTQSDRRPPRWRLGVYSQDTETGVQINRVVADTPADRAGLEASDVIVAVNGYQVGIVNGVHYDCGYEFENQADADGNVMLLVQDHRTKSLVNLPVDLDSRMESVTGNIAFRDRVSVPGDAEVHIELREVVRQGTPAVALASTTITEIRQIPIPFTVEYDPLDIDPRRDYMIHASIISGDRTLYATTDQYPVITADHGNNVSVAVVRAQQTPAASADAQREELETQIVAWYRQYLGRDPYPYELPTWTSLVTERGRTTQEVQAEVLAQDEIYNHCDRDKRQYIAFLSEQILGRPPTADELDFWIYRFDQSGVRKDLTNEFLSQYGQPR